jgi:hypothetical protein
VVRGQLDWLLVQSGQEALCESHFGHDCSLETSVQRVSFGEEIQVCGVLRVIVCEVVGVSCCSDGVLDGWTSRIQVRDVAGQ